MDIQELVVKSIDENTWKIVGLIGLNDQKIFDSHSSKLPASYNTIIIVKDLLTKGKDIYVSKNIRHGEIVPNDLIIKETDDLQCAKNLALNDINNLIYQNSFNVSVFDCFEYLNCYMKMMSNGIFITDQNREDKYFEIIEAAQMNEKPEDLNNNSTFEEEQEYFKKKQLYDQSNDNLKLLEQYLNSYDKISKIVFMNNKLNKIKTDIDNCQTLDEVKKILSDFNNSKGE